MGEEGVSPRQRLAQAKQKIKVWEGEYKATYGCPPDREAMAQAPEDIRHAYKTYRYYRKAVTEQNLAAHDPKKSSSRDKELLHTSHNAKDCILARDKEPISGTHDIKEGNLAKGKEVLRLTSSGDLSSNVPVSSADNLVTSQHCSMHEESSTRQAVVDMGGVDVCDSNVRLTSDINASVFPEIETKSINNSVSETKNCNTTATTGNSNNTETTGNMTPAVKFAETSFSTWGKHLNKGNHRPKEVKKDTSLYTKMAEKLRAKSTIKMRKSLTRTSSISKPQEKSVLGVSSPQTSWASISDESTETSNDSKGGSCSDFSFSKIEVSGKETLQDDSQVSTSESKEVSDDAVDELRPLSVFEAVEANHNEEFNPVSELSGESERPTSIFDALEYKSLETLREKNIVNKPKPLLSMLDTVESDSLEKTLKYHEVPSSQKTPVVQPISVLSTLSQTHTSGLSGIKKRAPLNLGWVSRCTGMPLDGNVAAEQNVPQESWKMKLIDKEWSEDAEKEELQEEDPSIKQQCNDVYVFSVTKNESESIKAPESSLMMNSVESAKTNAPPTSKNSKKSTKTAVSSANLNFSSPTKTNVREPVKATKRNAVRKTTTKGTQKKDTPLATPSNTGRVLRTRSTRNTPQPDYAKDSEEEDYNVTTSSLSGGQKRRVTEEDEEWQDFGNIEQLENQERTTQFSDEEAENFESEPAISEVCMRKRRKIESLEELEEQGRIQSQWPPPKKKRVARKKPAARSRPRKVDKENSPKVKRPVRKRKIIKHEEKEEDEVEVEEKGLSVDRSTQPSAPRIDYNETDDIESHGTKNTSTKGRYLTGKERLMKKVSTGSLNNNFVRINLKKKVYVRGKKTMNSGKYKRQEWKKKQLMKSAEGGNVAAVKTLTCFKCGDFGHWAKSCPGKRGDKLTPLEEYDENESTFLSLEEAASMALGIKKIQSGPSVSKLYPKATEAERSDETTATASDGNNEADVGGSSYPEVQEKPGDTEKEIDTVNTEMQAVPAVTNEDSLPDSNNTTNDPDQDNDSQQAASLAEYDFMDSDDDIFGNLEETDFQEQQHLEPSSSQESTGSTAQLGSSQESTSSTAQLGSSQESTSSTAQLGSSQSYSTVWEERPTVEPLYSLSDGEVIATPEEVHDALRKFGYPSFRPGQEEAVMRILSGQSTLLVLSTGSGKSLCYQLPAYLYAKHRSPCITLCVSPLVSLMEDQVMGLPRFLKAVCLHTHQNQSQRSQALTAIHSRAVHILLVSPEAVVASRTGGVLGTLLKELPPVAFACLDEAHCVSEWSHNFRPSYLRVCQVLRERLGVKTILGLTATARHATALSIARHLLIPDFDTGVIRGTSVPDNLQLSISRDRNREEALVSLLQGERFSGCTSIIIYCTRRDECERVATLIRTQLLDPSKIDVKSNLKRNRGLSFDAEAYHAGLSSHRRHQVQKRFMSGKLRIVVATVAFGMGIDKSDVRGIIHFNMPRNVESYVQEIGRAGRDGEEAHCHLFLDDQDGRDIQELKRHIFANSVDRHTIRKLLSKIFKPCTCAKLKSLSSGGEEKVNDLPIDIPSSPVHSTSDSKDTEAGNTGTAADPFSVPTTPSCCPRHEVAIPIEAVVEELDLPEENLETLLCYLELHQGNLIHINSHVYANCTVSCYGGPRQLVAVSRRCPPLAVAIALARQKGKDFTTSNSVSFPVVEVASRMGWNSRIVKRELKSLEWNMQGLHTGGNVKRSGVVVEMTDLSFHLEARGDLSDDERDRVLDAVYRRTKVQEQDQLRQLHYTYQLLRSVSHSTILFCCDSVDQERCDRLRTELREYFRSDSALSEVQVEEKRSVRPEVECGIRSSVRAFLSTYNDQQWTGRAVARVFHGIGSPNYPTEVWGRVRRYWRQHLNADFSVLVNIATQEILRCK